MFCRTEFGLYQPFKGAKMTGSLHMTIQTAVLIETHTALVAEVRWCSCYIFFTQRQSPFRFTNYAMEGAIKWDPVYSKETDGHPDDLKSLDQKLNAASMISTLEKELEQARGRIEELEAKRRSLKKKLEHFLKKLSEERVTWRSREHEKVRAIIDDVKADLSRERKNRQRLEIVNSKLVNEMAEGDLLLLNMRNFRLRCQSCRRNTKSFWPPIKRLLSRFFLIRRDTGQVVMALAFPVHLLCLWELKISLGMVISKPRVRQDMLLKSSPELQQFNTFASASSSSSSAAPLC